jgi:hypothetical protein
MVKWAQWHARPTLQNACHVDLWNVHAEWSLCICMMVLAPVQSQVW